MSAYYTRYCAKHGEWEYDLDNPGEECPDCVKAGCAPSQIQGRALTALGDLLEQIDTLEGVTYTRDLEPYKAEACWNDACERARAAYKEATNER